MSDFLSINPAPETVMIDGKKYPVPGISMTGLGHLIPRFPKLATDLQERIQKDGGLTVTAIFEVAGPAIGPILAAGLGYPGNEEAEQKAAQLAATTQIKILEKIIEKTIPDGPSPFVADMAAVMQRFAPPKVRLKVLQRTSNASSVSSDIPQAKSGT